ncbi:MAG: lytic transglycosylase domain-containing protein, partial [Myxococcota bacterium]
TEDGATKHAYATQGHHQDEAAWILAWIEKRRGSQPAQVEEWLSRISDRTPVGLGARYWLARFSRDRGDLEAAQTLSTQVTALAPRHFYALAARDLICEAGGPCASTLEPVSAERPKHTARDLIAAVQFFDVGLEDTAHRLVERLPYRGLAPVDRAYFAWLHSRRNETRTAARVTRSLEGEADLLSDRSVLNAGYPTVFEDIVEREATRSGVPSALLLAVMREESGFDPGALSPRGARGLMQMIPRTARRMARSAGLRGFRLGKLFSPETSIRLGAHYLRLLLDEFDGDLPAAVASYHAGEKTVARWKAASPSTSSDEFIEEIPYSSTRAYVKRVLGTYGTYRELSLTSEGQAQTSEPVLKLSHAERAPQQG